MIAPQEISFDSLITLRSDIRVDKRVQHLRDILKCQLGDQLKVGIINTGHGQAEVIDWNEQQYSFQLKLLSHSPDFKKPWCHLIIGLSRPPTIKKILEHATSLGVGHFHFIVGDLSEKSYAQSKIFQKNLYEEILLLGLAQSTVYVQLPTVTLYSCTDHFFHQGQKLLPAQGMKWVLDPQFSSYFSHYQTRASSSLNISLAIGPERGWTDRERKLFLDSQFRPLKISQSTLRVENSVISALAQWELIQSFPEAQPFN